MSKPAPTVQPQTGGSFIRESDGSLRPARAPAQLTPAKSPKPTPVKEA